MCGKGASPARWGLWACTPPKKNKKKILKFRPFLLQSKTSLALFKHHDSVLFKQKRLINNADLDPHIGLTDISLRGGKVNITKQHYFMANSKATGRDGIGVNLLK